MDLNFMFFINSVLFGVGLAMDAFSVSLAAGMNNTGKKVPVAGTFAAFQTAMPLIGWFCIHTVAEAFMSFQKFIPWIALVLLLFIGGKMIFEGIKGKQEGETPGRMNVRTLLVMGVATSIDALSVGFTIAEYTFLNALIESLIIGAITFLICIAGVEIGRRLGMKLAGKASIFGGIILIGIGLEIFLTGVIFK